MIFKLTTEELRLVTDALRGHALTLSMCAGRGADQIGRELRLSASDFRRLALRLSADAKTQGETDHADT